MAKKTTSVSFKNATINLEDMTITEVTKDDSLEYNLLDVLSQWNGVEGVALSIKQDTEIASQS